MNTISTHCTLFVPKKRISTQKLKILSSDTLAYCLKNVLSHQTGYAVHNRNFAQPHGNEFVFIASIIRLLIASCIEISTVVWFVAKTFSRLPKHTYSDSSQPDHWRSLRPPEPVAQQLGVAQEAGSIEH